MLNILSILSNVILFFQPWFSIFYRFFWFWMKKANLFENDFHLPGTICVVLAFNAYTVLCFLEVLSLRWQHMNYKVTWNLSSSILAGVYFNAAAYSPGLYGLGRTYSFHKFTALVKNCPVSDRIFARKGNVTKRIKLHWNLTSEYFDIK